MASPTPPPPPLPTRSQCDALTDEQCQHILRFQDPDNQRKNADWQAKHQPELVRCYMAMLSFTQIQDHMKPHFKCSYKTYQNRFRDWSFPLDRSDRETLVRQLYAQLPVLPGNTPYAPVDTFRSRIPIRPLLPQPPSAAPQPRLHNYTSVAQRAVYQTQAINRSLPAQPDNRLSVSTTGTFASGSTQSYGQYEDSLSGRWSSLSTPNSVMSAGSQYEYAPSLPAPPKHDPVLGLWNGILRVIPCGQDHSELRHYQEFQPCNLCGFAPGHSLMLHAQSIDIDGFVAAMSVLRNTLPDRAGNTRVHYLMAAGVGIDFISKVFQSDESFWTNVYGQNPIHALNPRGLGEEQLVSFLEWLRDRENPAGRLVQRDNHCNTPLHALLLWPLERHIVSKILRIFPFAEQQLRARDTKGRTIIKLMDKASLKLEETSLSDYKKLQEGITEVIEFLEDHPDSTSGYGFHDIARGARGFTAYGGTFFECAICKQSNAHDNSSLAQMICANAHGRDRYGPDEFGRTPAHALVLLQRCESPSETAQLFKYLVNRLSSADDLNVVQVLGALDPRGNSLVWNVAKRGLDDVLSYILNQPATLNRRRAMVNFCSQTSKGEQSVLARVCEALQEIQKLLNDIAIGNDRRDLIQSHQRYARCRTLLIEAGAVMTPDIATRWSIC